MLLAEWNHAPGLTRMTAEAERAEADAAMRAMRGNFMKIWNQKKWVLPGVLTGAVFLAACGSGGGYPISPLVQNLLPAGPNCTANQIKIANTCVSASSFAQACTLL